VNYYIVLSPLPCPCLKLRNTIRYLLQVNPYITYTTEYQKQLTHIKGETLTLIMERLHSALDDMIDQAKQPSEKVIS